MKAKTHGRYCSARRSNGQPCRKWATNGATVCRKHGAAAPQVKRAAAQRVQDMLAEAIDPDRVLRESARLAYSDIRQLFKDNRLLPMDEWPDDVARAVSSVEVVRRNVDSGDGHTDDVIKLRLWDKVSKLTNLMKHHGQLKETLGGTIALEVKWKGE